MYLQSNTGQNKTPCGLVRSSRSLHAPRRLPRCVSMVKSEWYERVCEDTPQLKAGSEVGVGGGGTYHQFRWVDTRRGWSFNIISSQMYH